jgi:hypothetical protein
MWKRVADLRAWINVSSCGVARVPVEVPRADLPQV